MTTDLNVVRKILIIEYEAEDVLDAADCQGEEETDWDIAWEALVSVYDNWCGGEIDNDVLSDAYWDLYHDKHGGVPAKKEVL